MTTAMTNEEVELALDFELERSRVWSTKVRKAVSELENVFDCLDEYRQLPDQDRPVLFTTYLRHLDPEHHALPPSASAEGEEESKGASHHLDAASPHAFEKQRGRPLVERAGSPVRVPPSAQAHTATASSATNISTLLERLKKQEKTPLA